MMVIYGDYRKLKIDKDLGEMVCPNCGHRVNAALARETHKPHICYIPVFYYTGWRIKFCPNCGVMERLSKEEYNRLKNEG